MFQDTLSTIGLTFEEADIYQSLLNQSPQTASQLARSTKVKRTYVYSVIKSLIKKGLATQETRGKTTNFIAQSPDKLLEIAQSHQLAASQAQIALENILPTLKSQYSLSAQKPVISYFEGVEGVKKVFQDIYGPKDEPVYGCVDIETADKTLPGHIMEKLIPQRINNKVEAISFIADSPQARQIQAKDSQSLRQSHLVDKSKYPLPAEIDVYQDKIAMLSFDKGQFIGILIQNQSLATSLKSIFKLAMAHQKPQKK